jgi:hypothetical protein
MATAATDDASHSQNMAEETPPIILRLRLLMKRPVNILRSFISLYALAGLRQCIVFTASEANSTSVL